MPVGVNYALQGLLPALSSTENLAGPCILPCGGPVGVGGAFAQGQTLGFVSGTTLQSQVFTTTITTNGASGGIGYWIYYGDIPYSGLANLATGGLTANTVTTFPTAAQMTTALAATVPEWSGNVTVTGSTGGPYTVTFNNLMANKLIGGLLQFVFASATGGPPTAAVTTAQSGWAGSAQVNLYSQASNNRVNGFLINSQSVDPGGMPGALDLAGEVGQIGAGVSMWKSGYFYNDLTNFPEKSVIGLDANAMTLGNVSFFQGTSLSSPACIVKIA